MNESRSLRPARPRRRTRRCPICGAPLSVAAWRPFCSQRCADADLANWLSGNYRIPSAEDDASDVDEADGSGNDLTAE